MAFSIIDANKDGMLTYSDFQSLFNSYDQYGGQKIDEEMWQQLLKEADKNGDGAVNFEEFRSTMKDMVRKSWLRVQDRSISPSRSPTKFKDSDEENSPIIGLSTPSPNKQKKRGGLIISPIRNPFNKLRLNSPCKTFKLIEIDLDDNDPKNNNIDGQCTIKNMR